MVIVRRAIPHHLCRRWSSNKGYLHGSGSYLNHHGCYFSTDSSKEKGSSAMKASTKIPKKANVVVVGGGIIGTSVAYNLAKFGVEDVVLLERDKLTSGTTWHAAGLINTFGSLSSTSTFMRKVRQHRS
jgi:NADPH-dependent 2,4-dienoyl-CoA reductase/sulfur reductase-like enzyme